MADTNTTYLQLVKPELDGSQHTWGNKLNNNFDVIDGLFPDGILAVTKGGTGAVDVPGARANLGIGTVALEDASNATFTDLKVDNKLGIGTPSPTVDMEVAGNLKGTNLETTGVVQVVNYTLPSSFSHGNVSVTSTLRIAATNKVKNSSGGLVIAPTSIIELNSDVSYAIGDVKSIPWSTKVFDELGVSLNDVYITGFAQGIYRVSLCYHLVGSSVNFSFVDGILIVNDATHEFRVPLVNLTADEMFTTVTFTVRMPNSSTNNCKILLLNYTGKAFTLKGSSSAQKARVVFTRLS